MKVASDGDRHDSTYSRSASREQSLQLVRTDLSAILGSCYYYYSADRDAYLQLELHIILSNSRASVGANEQKRHAAFLACHVRQLPESVILSTCTNFLPITALNVKIMRVKSAKIRANFDSMRAILVAAAPVTAPPRNATQSIVSSSLHSSYPNADR